MGTGARSASADDAPPSGRRTHVDATATDVPSALASLTAAYPESSWRSSAADDPFAFRYAAAGDETMTVRALRFDGRLDADLPQHDDYVVAVLGRGTGTIVQHGTEVVLEVGRPQLWPDGVFHAAFDRAEQRLVHVRRTAVAELAATRGTATRRLRFDHTAPPSDAAARQWRSTARLLSATVLDRGASPVLLAELARIAAVALLDLYPVAADAMPPALLMPAQARIRAAVEFVHEHAHQAVTSTDLAEVAGVSLRTLQQAFLRHFDVTPNTYLRNVRLDRIHDELTHADPDATSVAEVARRWGIAHASRFSAAYAERFGHYPSETLQAHRP